MSIEQIIIDRVLKLPPNKQQEVLDFVEFLLLKIQNSMIKKGKFIDFYLPYSQHGNHISAESQAQKILQEADTLLKKGSFGGRNRLLSYILPIMDRLKLLEKLMQKVDIKQELQEQIRLM
jgi:hypothetical protein